MHIFTDLAAVRVPDDEVGHYSVTGGGWYAIDGEDKAVLGPFESSGRVRPGDSRSGQPCGTAEPFQFPCPGSLKGADRPAVEKCCGSPTAPRKELGETGKAT